jgi:DNA processing protein
VSACEACLRRTWLLERLSGHLERRRAVIDDLLERADRELIALLGGDRAADLLARHARFGAEESGRAREQAHRAGLELICRHDDRYPARLRELETLAPALLAVNGAGERSAALNPPGAVAVVGTRRPTGYGLGAARRLAGELAAAGVTVISGMAYGIDGAAHEGAIAAGGLTVAVLAAAAERPSPAGQAPLFAAILAGGLVVSEFGPGVLGRRWAFQARNRIVAGLADATVVIEATTRSGALITARASDRLHRFTGALPGPVGVPQSSGPNEMLAKFWAARGPLDPTRVRAVRDAQDVLDLLYGEGIVEVPRVAPTRLTPDESRLLEAIRGGLDSVAALGPRHLATLTALELKGAVRRGPGGTLEPGSD